MVGSGTSQIKANPFGRSHWFQPIASKPYRNGDAFSTYFNQSVKAFEFVKKPPSKIKGKTTIGAIISAVAVLSIKLDNR